MSEWRRGTIGELAKGYRGVTYAAGQLRDFKSPDTTTLLRSNNISSGRLNYEDVQIVPSHLVSEDQLLQPGDIAVCMSNGSKTLVGKAAPFLGSQGERFTVGAFCSVFRPTDASAAAFISYVFQSKEYRKNLDFALAGSAINNLRNADVEAFRCDIPPPVEQVKIARVLHTLDTAILETEAIIAKLKAVKQGLLHDLLTRGIDANGELRPPQAEAPHLYKLSPLGWIPNEWVFDSLTSKIDFPEGQVDPRQAPFRDWVLVAPDHIESGTGRLISRATAAEQQAISGKYVFEVGDVLYSKIRPYLRKAVLASVSGLCSADMYPLRPKAGVNSRYLLAVLLANQFSRFSESVSMRSGFPKINRSEMGEFSMGWPCADEQARIAQVLIEADTKQASAEDEREKLMFLKSGLMDDLLTGHVRVTPLLQEPQAA